MGINSFVVLHLLVPPFTSFRFHLFFCFLISLTIFKRSVAWCFLFFFFCAADGRGSEICCGWVGFSSNSNASKMSFLVSPVFSFSHLNDSSLPASFSLGISNFRWGFIFTMVVLAFI